METTVPTDDQVKKLMDAVLTKRNVRLSEMQRIKFKQACKKSYIDNPHLSFGELKEAANIYLNFILDFPGLTL